MNERIQELTRQAVIEMRAEKTDLPPLDDIVLQKILELREEYDEKFAELILRECAEKIAHNERFNWLDAAQAAKDLLQHFGVK